jgi:CTD small phosphatase-like protein 2
MSLTMLVDNSPYAYGYQVDNGIPIESWFDDDSDTELLKLSGFLRRLQHTSDVRPIIRDHFKTYKLVERAGLIRRKSLESTP